MLLIPAPGSMGNKSADPAGVREVTKAGVFHSISILAGKPTVR